MTLTYVQVNNIFKALTILVMVVEKTRIKIRLHNISALILEAEREET